jgi:MFS family permease
MLGAVMSILDTTIVNVALATLGKDLHSSLASIQWVVTGYMLSLAAVIPVTGWASRRFGAKRVFLISLVLFTLGSLLCGLATSATELILFRVLQGVGGGMIMPLAQIIMADTGDRGPDARSPRGRRTRCAGPLGAGPPRGPVVPDHARRYRRRRAPSPDGARWRAALAGFSNAELGAAARVLNRLADYFDD